MTAEVAGDPGHAPAGRREAEHLQPVASARLGLWVVGAPLQFVALGIGQMNTVHPALPPMPSFLRIYSVALLSEGL